MKLFVLFNWIAAVSATVITTLTLLATPAFADPSAPPTPMTDAEKLHAERTGCIIVVCFVVGIGLWAARRKRRDGN